jgi:prepilin-type processing-associated H-X9-DG protein
MIAVTDTNADGKGDFQSHPTSDVPWVYPGSIHSGGSNVLFCDGHVQWYLQKDLLVTNNQALVAEDPVVRMWNNDHSLQR